MKIVKNPILLALLSGVLMALSWPEIGGFSLSIFFGFVPLLILSDSYNKGEIKKIFPYLYLAFFTWNLITTWWIYYASFGGAVMAIVFNSFFMAVVFNLFQITTKIVGYKKGVYSLLFYWIGFEYLHLNWDLSWTWLTLGNVFANQPYFVQWYEYTGVLGGSFWVLTINLLMFKLWKNRLIIKQQAPLIVLILFVFIAPMGWSVWKYNTYEDNGKTVEIAVVQPNIDPYHDKFGNSTLEEQLAKMFQLANTVVTPSTDLILFPETAIPYGIWENNIKETTPYREVIKFQNKLSKNTPVLIGATTLMAYENKIDKTATSRKMDGSNVWYDRFNSALFFNISSKSSIYHKSKLVLGVEKIPFPSVFKHFEKFAINLGGTVGSLGIQNNRTVFTSKLGIKLAPLICYESIYGEFVSKFTQKGANLLTIITNDGWWENTAGYRQHFAYARLRAIENRKYVARSANTGISGFIDSKGKVLQKSDWWVATALTQKVKLNNTITTYAQLGDFIGRIMAFCAVLMFLWTFVNKYKNNSISLK